MTGESWDPLSADRRRLDPLEQLGAPLTPAELEEQKAAELAAAAADAARRAALPPRRRSPADDHIRAALELIAAAVTIAQKRQGGKLLELLEEAQAAMRAAAVASLSPEPFESNWPAWVAPVVVHFPPALEQGLGGKATVAVGQQWQESDGRLHVALIVNQK